MGVDNIEAVVHLTERDKIIKESRDKEQKLKLDINRQNTYKKLNFHYDTADIPQDGSSLIKTLKEQFKDEDSREGALLNNPQVQNLLANILGEHVRERNKKKNDREQQEKDKKPEGQENKKEEEVESWEDYRERESSPENFEEFLLSDTGIRILIDEIDKHLDDDGKINDKYPIYEKDLKLKLKKSRYSLMQREYNEKNGISTSIEMQEINQMGNIVADGIDTAVGNYLKSGGNNFDGGMVKTLESLLNNDENKEIIKKMEQNSTLKDNFNRALKESIKKYSEYVLVGDKLSLDTGNKQTDLQLRSYLFIYGKFFYPGIFKTNQGNQYYEQILPKIMEAVLVADGDERLKNIVKNNIFLEKEKKAEEERKNRDKQRRQEIAKRNRENNDRYHPDNNGSGRRFYDSDNISGDIDGATGEQIVRNSNINLSDFKVNNGIENYTNSGYAKQKAFGIAWKKFVDSNNEIKDIITPEDMRNLYNVDTNSIDEDSRKEFLKSDIMQGKSQEEIDKIRNILLKFPEEYKDALNSIPSMGRRQALLMDERTKNFALGSVIDNVRFVFADIVEKWKGDSKFEGFKFDGSEPVKREGNDIIISGTFNGTAIKIRYDLISGGLFMNSFLQHPSTSKIAIGNNSNADIQIGQLESFDTILEEHYRAPEITFSRGSQAQYRGVQTAPSQNSGAEQGGNIGGDGGEVPTGNINKKGLHFAAQHFMGNRINNEEPTPAEPATTEVSSIATPSGKSSFGSYTSEIGNRNSGEIDAIRKKYRDMLHANLDMISNKIIDNTKKQSARNSAVTKFMKTFNIIVDGQEDKTIEFNDGSNLFDLIQLIENSEPDVLEKFQVFMEKVSDYSGLNRGNNNILGSQRNSKYDITFNENNKNKYISLVRDNAKSFSENLDSFKGKMNFDSDSQLGFAKMITENITNNVSKPNWKLDASKMDDFIRHLENDGKDS